jgi:hypothetical protein
MKVKLLVLIVLLLKYNITSAVKNTFVFKNKPTCGLQNPTQSFDCSQASTDSDTCCYFTYGSQKGCFKLGYSYSGSYSLEGLNVYCSSILMKGISLIFLLVAII